MYDRIIKGGTVVDGSGSAPFTADVALQDGRIAEGWNNFDFLAMYRQLGMDLR